ncbi:TetR/AcrR family transcriptional regulator [Pseudorhodoplanes sp.]|jgi:AcrR family transcriptional regulator|uniref:TetR/AcrR family transcriptional regulator n=1 Tax=Pseudorhodoplanes sp. TaxID=1934341 RepID=UPI002B7BD020|nr:TetR family transcriptional regulator [Pseudorhodoplanes sp.]HWV42489.1 TetR family transcriptional regulator [Pseudorhodoplanes sp.]
MARGKAAVATEAAPRKAALDAAAWIGAALDALATDGIEAVRIEPLAKVLHVTKGSFYWHFADRRALIDAMLSDWASGRIAAIREQAPSDSDPALALRRLVELYTRRGNARGLAIELAIRALARNDAAAARAVQAVDAERLRLVTALFERLGWPERDASARAMMVYAFLFGQSLLDPKSVRAGDVALALDSLLAPPR